MLNAYKNAIIFYKNNINLLMISVLVAVINVPLKATSFTILGGLALSMFFAGGFAGLVANRDKEKIGLKAFIFQSAKSYGVVSMNLVESLIISFLNFLLVLFFGILPMIILQASPNEEYSKVVLGMMIILVLIYRMPLFLYSFAVGTLNKKEYGKYGIAKIKKVIWENYKMWLNAIFQFLIYGFMLLLQYVFFEGNGYLYTLLDIGKAIIFTFFIVTNVLYFEKIVDGKEEYKETVDQYTYKENAYSTFAGRFLM